MLTLAKERKLGVLCFSLFLLPFALVPVIFFCLLLLIICWCLVLSQRLETKRDANFIGLFQTDTLLKRHGMRLRLLDIVKFEDERGARASCKGSAYISHQVSFQGCLRLSALMTSLLLPFRQTYRYLVRIHIYLCSIHLDIIFSNARLMRVQSSSTRWSSGQLDQ